MPIDHAARPRRSAPWQWLAILAAPVLLAAGGDSSVDPAADLEARRQRVQAMSPDRFEHVLHNRDRLAEMPAAEQDKLRRLADELEQAPDADRLRHTMLRYHEWLRKLNLPQRSELLELPPEQRLAKIKQIRAQQHALIHAETAGGEPLSAADLDHILKWIEHHAEQHREKLLAELTPERRRQIEQYDPSKRRRAMWAVLTQRNHNGRVNIHSLPAPTPAEMKSLVDKLSPAARESIHLSGSTAEQWKHLRRWSQTAVRQRLEESGLVRPMPTIAVEELQRYFESGLTPQKREELLNMPPERMQRELRRMFFQQPGHTEPNRTEQPSRAGAAGQSAEPADESAQSETVPRGEGAVDKQPAAANAPKPPKKGRGADRPRGRNKDASSKEAHSKNGVIPEAKDAPENNGD